MTWNSQGNVIECSPPHKQIHMSEMHKHHRDSMRCLLLPISSEGAQMTWYSQGNVIKCSHTEEKHTSSSVQSS